ncbi:CopY family transcriptional regulator [Xylanimonas oleitrophica]|uniref:CopY family transcriptional regulator n=1 Tax=Xylanimonas oleitrophica TaxID=2607479 RepID=A0A2W5WLU8_9MICO|nr:metal-sensitive transcriptional regulator [Xylanimonas oleitrophica]PZR51673.1 CopY family transcriptional regulator [Xylanimonas oleitrophica]
MAAADPSTVLARLHRVEGQVRGIAHMVDQQAYCIDVVTQISAASRALQSAALMLLLDDHLRNCLSEAAQTGGGVHDDKVREAMGAISRLVRSQ